MSKKRIVITGAAGLVGSHFVDLMHKEHDLYALIRRKPEHSLEQVTYLECDLTQGCLPDTLPKKIDAVIHLAQSNKIRDFPVHAVDVFQVNVHTTALLLEYAQRSGASHFVFTSTGGIYGSSTDPFKEEGPIQIDQGPLAYYFRTKYASEQLIKAYESLMSVHILRPFFIYGNNQKNEMLIPRLIHNVREGNPISLQGENGIVINPVYVNDVVCFIAAILSINPGTTVNMAGPDPLSIREIAEIIGEFVHKKPIFSQKEGQPQNIIGNNERMCAILKEPLMTFQKGISLTLHRTLERV
jgi:UDP-glucose 4-epimerase